MSQVLYSGKSMGNWKSKVRRKAAKVSRTPGRGKREDTCQATKEDKFMARRGRAYKYKGYGQWCEKYRVINHGK